MPQLGARAAVAGRMLFGAALARAAQADLPAPPRRRQPLQLPTPQQVMAAALAPVVGAAAADATRA